MTTFVDQRRQKRVTVGLPVRVKGFDLGGNRFDEVTKSVDVSPDGACILLKTPIRKGSMLDLSLPMPRQMQRAVAPKPVYETVGLVLRIESSELPPSCRVAVRFRPVQQKQYHSEA
ncbi:MAG TPA: PilZ domain-containing protein [Terriglobia bacterium]|nr:PilZ domain-containing protein [Terriglobia bacterium]